MSSTFYKALVALLSAGLLFAFGMWFGLAVISAPKGHSRIASVPLGATPVTAHRPHGAEKPRATDAADRAADHKLTPVYPAEPGPPKEKADADQKNAKSETAPSAAIDDPVAIATRQPVETTGSASREQHASPAPPTPSAARAADKNEDKNEMQTAERNPAHEAKARSAALSTTDRVNRCDVRSCAAAYRSFRESDCTFQPYSGPRQFCVKGPETARRQDDESPAYRGRVQAPQRERNADLDRAVRAVKQLTAGRRWSSPMSNPWDESRVDDAPPRIYVLPDDGAEGY